MTPAAEVAATLERQRIREIRERFPTRPALVFLAVVQGWQTFAVEAEFSKPPVRFMPWEHFEKYADYFWKRRPALALFVELLGETGARWNEIQTATSEGIDKKRRVRRAFVKPGRWVDVPAGPWLLAASRRAGGGLLAPREDGKAFTHPSYIRESRTISRFVLAYARIWAYSQCRGMNHGRH